VLVAPVAGGEDGDRAEARRQEPRRRQDDADGSGMRDGCVDRDRREAEAIDYSGRVPKANVDLVSDPPRNPDDLGGTQKNSWELIEPLARTRNPQSRDRQKNILTSII
jgi:hypothetical protein